MPYSILQNSFINLINFEKEALEAHNEYRLLHNVSPLQIDSALSNSARYWAKYLAQNEFIQNKNQVVGENILKANTNFLTGMMISNKIL